MSSSTPELDRSQPLNKVVVNESLLTNAFDDCLKLVEKSVNNSGGGGGSSSSNNNNKGNKTRKETPKKVKSEPTYRNGHLHKVVNQDEPIHKVELTHKSRKFRFSEEAKASNVPIVMPPPLDPESLPLSENEDEARASMLMSWYMAGYHTGYFEAMKKFKK